MYVLRHASAELYVAFIRCMLGGGMIREHVQSTAITKRPEHAVTFATQEEARTFRAMLVRAPWSLSWSDQLVVAPMPVPAMQDAG